MCISPVSIINPSKYVSLHYRDSYLLSVPCGHCVECQQTNSNQWFFRAYQECQDLQRDGGYIYFDTLTYKNTPLMSDLFPWLPSESCFSRSDIRKFIERLRIACKRIFNVTFRFFLSSEYGHDDNYYYRGRMRKATCRPHYHVMFFLPRFVDLSLFSRLVSDCWIHGRTDGVPYKSLAYIHEHNYISSNSLPLHYLRACRYVTKYVQKSCNYDAVIAKRLKDAIWQCAKHISPENPESWINSDNARHVKAGLKRQLCQFHSQSKHFGESYLSEFDLDSYLENGCIYMPSSKGLKIAIPLSTYYKRKLFYQLCEIDGAKTWQLNDVGKYVKSILSVKLIERLSDRFKSASLTYQLQLTDDDCHQLADYVYNYQGRIKADNGPSPNLLEKLSHIDIYNYSNKLGLGPLSALIRP